MLFLVHYCYRFLRTVVTIFCARLLPFSVHSLYHFLCTRNFCLHIAPLFAKAIDLENVILPKDFVDVIQRQSRADIFQNTI